jgi:hypothetical protein
MFKKKKLFVILKSKKTAIILIPITDLVLHLHGFGSSPNEKTESHLPHIG